MMARKLRLDRGYAALQPLQSRQTRALAGAMVALTLALAGAGCNPPPPQKEIVLVPSSKPYRYIRYSKHDDPETVKEINRHNQTHAKVKAAEAKAKEGK